MSKVNNLTICETQRRTKKPRRLLHSALDVMSVTRRKARRASETESPMNPKLSFGEAWMAKALSNTDEPKYAIGARAAIVLWNTERRSLSVLLLTESDQVQKLCRGTLIASDRMPVCFWLQLGYSWLLKQIFECYQFNQERGLVISYFEMLFVSVAPTRMKHLC